MTAQPHEACFFIALQRYDLYITIETTYKQMWVCVFQHTVWTDAGSRSHALYISST